jgi:nitrous oxidase accessory protein NosD
MKRYISVAFITALTLLFISCSGDKTSNPILTGSSSGLIPLGVTDTLSDGTPSGGFGTLGLFNLTIDKVNSSAELTPIRNSALTDVLEVVDITNFLQLAPCFDCVKLERVSIDPDGNLVLSIGIKHPFPAGDPLKPISGRNRADLHVFNVEGLVVSSTAGDSFGVLGQTVADFKLVNADGYSSYLDQVLDDIYPTDCTIHPYITHFDDYSLGNFDPSNPMGFASVTNPSPSGYLVMAMGCDYDVKDYVFDIDNSIDLIYAVGCTYAVSSGAKIERFTPEYRCPQHNKKAASEVSLVIVSNDLKGGGIASTAEIEIHVVDLNHGVEVGTGLGQMLAESNVDDIFVEIPGVMSNLLVLDGNNSISGTGHDPSDPLVYAGTITNTAGGAEGLYTGLIKVTDTYAPGQNASPLLNGMDGIERVDPIANPLTGLFAISEFATYQIFDIFVETGNEEPVAVLISDPDPADITQHQTVDFDATGSYDPDGSITLYEFDYEWDGIEANFTADDSSTSGLATSDPYSTPGTYIAGLRVTDNLGATGYDSVTVDVTDLNVIYVDNSYTGTTHDGTMTYPFITIPDAFAVAVPGDQVWVDDSGINYDGPITLDSGVTLKSFNWDTSDGTDQAAIYYTGTTAVVSGADGAVIDGFKIHGGSRYGVSVNVSDTTIKNCLIQNIIANNQAWGVIIQNSTGSVIENCEIDTVRTTQYYAQGYGISLINSPIEVTGCTIHNVETSGAYLSLFGIYADGCTPQGSSHLVLDHNDIHDIFTSGLIGGSYANAHGIYVNNSAETDIINNLIYSVTSGNYDSLFGVQFNNSSDLDFINNTIYDIEKTAYYGVSYGVYISACTNFDGRNNVVNKIAAGGYFQSAYGVSAPAGTVWEYNDVYDNRSGNYVDGITQGTGCINANPLFVNPGTDFHLASGSPCINTGDPNSIYNDWDGSRNDMGAYGGPGGNW